MTFFLPTLGMTLGFAAERSVVKSVQYDAVGKSKDGRAVQRKPAFGMTIEAL